MKKQILIALVLTVLASMVFGQSSKEKAQAMAAEFNKDKHKVKEKNGVTIEKNKVVEATPDARDNVAGYAGKYEMDGFGHSIVLRQTSNGWEGEYFVTKDDKEVKKAILKDIKIESALFSATIHHDDGRVLPFEGVFINRSSDGVTIRGLGIKHSLELSNGFVADKAFYKRVE